MKFFKYMVVVFAVCSAWMLPLNAADTAADETAAAAEPEVRVMGPEFVEKLAVVVEEPVSTLAEVKAVEATGKASGQYIVVSTHPVAAHHASGPPWWVFLSLATLIFIAFEVQFTRLGRGFLRQMAY